MEPEIQAQVDQIAQAVRDKAKADVEAQKAQIQKEAQATVLAALKSQLGI